MLHLAETKDDVMLEIEKPEIKIPPSIPIVHGPKLRSGVPIIVGVIPFGALMGNYDVPYYNFTTKRGYQRQPQLSRISQFATEIKKSRVDLPTAVLLNIRTKTALTALQDNRLFLDQLFSSNSAAKFYVVDGQHRILAFQKAFDDGWHQAAEFQVPFTCMLGADEDEEMEQFYVVNSNAKAVRTDLAYALLKKRSESEVGLMESLQERGRDWQVSGQAIVERLAVESVVWKKRIRLPGMEKGETTIPSASMVTSLKPVLTSPYFSRLKADQQIRVLEAFWEGIRNLLRDAFDSPSEYAIQKGVGVVVMHAVFSEILELVRDKGLAPTDPKSFEQVLGDSLNDLVGETSENKTVEGVDFWATGPRGAAGTYSSSSGQRVLIAKIRSRLPEMDVTS
jgi:DGQHR domain-containing protein